MAYKLDQHRYMYVIINVQAIKSMLGTICEVVKDLRMTHSHQECGNRDWILKFPFNKIKFLKCKYFILQCGFSWGDVSIDF